MQNKHRKDEDALLKKKADERELLRKKKQNMQKGSNPTIPPLETDESVLIDTAIDYFYEQGINEEGLDLIIEEVGVDTFTDFIIDLPQQLDEERSATKAPKRDYEKVKAAVYKKDAARKEKGTGEYSTTKAAKAKYGDEEAPEGKVATATTKAKKVQPKKPATKQGLGDRIKSAYKAGVKRHRKATQVPRVFAKGAVAGAKKAVKFAKDVKKVVSEHHQTDKDGKVIEHSDGTSSAVNENLKSREQVLQRKQLVLDRQKLMLRRRSQAMKKKEENGGTNTDAQANVIANESRDRALDIVRASILKKHGKGAIYDPKTVKKPSEADKAKAAAERKKRQDADNKAYAARAKKAGYKNPQDYTNVVARYGSEDNYKKGRGLGT